MLPRSTLFVDHTQERNHMGQPRHLPQKETEARKVWATFPRVPRMFVAESSLEHRSPPSSIRLFFMGHNDQIASDEKMSARISQGALTSRALFALLSFACQVLSVYGGI